MERRPDVAVHTGPTLVDPLSIAGDVRLELTVSVGAEDADVVAFLVDVTPEGVCEPITEGIARLRYREGTACASR